MASIDIDDVKHVARLARVALTDEQTLQMADELGTILEHVGNIAELDLDGVPPTTRAAEVTNVLGADEPRESLDRDRALASAPDPADGCFRVPRMQS